LIYFREHREIRVQLVDVDPRDQKERRVSVVSKGQKD
jgi:hypothetical protein